MKIGLLTYHAACNFGANLQALSTVEYFRNAGHDIYVIDWYSEELELFYRNSTPEKQYLCHVEFRQKYLPLTNRCINEIDVARTIEELGIEAVIVGSDAVAQHHPLKSRRKFAPRLLKFTVYEPTKDRMFPNCFWGSFVNHLKTPIPIAMMSGSSQNSDYKLMTMEEKETMKEYVKRFSYISTRDSWTSDMIKYITDGAIIPTVTPDPVFAFNYNVKTQPTKDEILKKYKLPNHYFLVSFHNSNTVSQEWLGELKSKSSKKGIECIAMAFPQGMEFIHPFDYAIDIPLSPMDWYCLIKYSDGYIGHNMHPIVVCLHNAVPCYSFDNYGVVKMRLFVNDKSSKIYHILSIFGLLGNRTRSVGKRVDVPIVDDVLERMTNFNKGKVSTVSNAFFNKYKTMMGDMLNSIIR